MIVRTARDLGAAIRDARLGKGWTQAELADRIHVSRQRVISFERGKATIELGTALRAVRPLGMVANLVEAPTSDTGIDLARRAGMIAPTTSIRTFGTERTLVVERHDRIIDAPGALVRVRQEGLCQAISVHPDRKYEVGPGERRRPWRILRSTRAFLRGGDRI